MTRHEKIHRQAILSLFVVAGTSVVGGLERVTRGPAVMMILTPLFSIGIWWLLLWKIWKRPRQWGLGVGIFLFVMVAFQSYLWWLAIHNPMFDKITTGRSRASFILLYELPIFAAGTYCILLRFSYPKEPKS